MGAALRLEASKPCPVEGCDLGAFEPCPHITHDQFHATGGWGPQRDASAGRAGLLVLLDGLQERGLIDRVQIVTCEGASIQLGPKPYEPPALAHGETKEEPPGQPTPMETLFAASEGFTER